MPHEQTELYTFGFYYCYPMSTLLIFINIPYISGVINVLKQNPTNFMLEREN